MGFIFVWFFGFASLFVSWASESVFQFVRGLVWGFGGVLGL